MENFTFIISFTVSYFTFILNKFFDTITLFYLYSIQTCHKFSNELAVTIFTYCQTINIYPQKNLVLLSCPIN